MADRPNVLFLVLDAVRTDHVSCYGYERETTPNIDALAADGVRYENAIAPSIWTPTVHGAIFTGQYPSHTGIYGNSLGIPKDVETVPEAFKAQGYTTFAASAGAHIRADRGYARGIDDYVETRRIAPDADFVHKTLSDRSFAKQVTFSLTRGPDDKTYYKYDRLKRFVDGAIDDDRPFFGFINAKTAHSPFNPPRPYKGKYLDGFDRPRYEFLERLYDCLGRRTQTVDGFDDNKLRDVAHSGGDEVLAGEIEMSDAEWDVVKAWYDGAINYLDHRVGDLVDFLRRRGVFDDTMVVVCADHGDNFGDHGLTNHIFCLYDSLVRVPMVISPPADGPSGRVVDAQVSLVDLEPTFREAADAPLRDYPHTESLLDFEDRTYHDYTFAEYAGFDGPIKRLQRKFPGFDATQFARPMQSIRDETHKLIVDSEGERELYEWRTDRGELTNLVDERPTVADRLESALRDRMDPLEMPEAFEEPDDPELNQQLKDLGYL
jgi:arylsulfatase A-like enzyme